MNENSLAWSFVQSIGRSFLPSLDCKFLFVFPLTNAKHDLTKRKMLSNGSANVKRSQNNNETDYMSRAWGFSYFNCFKKKLESICCPSYEINVGSWQAWVLIT